MDLLIDADSIIYKAGFVTEKTVYEVIGEDGDGDMRRACFDDKQKAAEWIHANGLHPEEVDITVTREAEPAQNACQIMRIMIEGIRDGHPLDNTFVSLSGPDNYRDRIATIKPYKGNRDRAHRPIHYAAMRDYLVRVYEADISSNCEADDVVSYLAAELRRRDAPYIIAHIDKDLDQIPGRHFNYAQQVYYDVSEEEAAFWFWRQVLTGDASDNVGGCYKVGPAKAEHLIREQIKQDGGVDDGRMWELIVRTYAASQKQPGCTYADMSAEDAALENAQLVYLQRNPDELWLPHGERGKVCDV
jgi:hypothetical protein